MVGDDKNRQINEKDTKKKKKYFKFTTNKYPVHFLCESILDNLGYHRPGTNGADVNVWKFSQLRAERIKETLQTNTNHGEKQGVCSHLPCVRTVGAFPSHAVRV